MDTCKLYLLLLVILPRTTMASSIDINKGVFEFNGLAALAIVSGAYCIYLGYKIIFNDKSKGNININMEVPEKGKLTVSGAPSGVAFMIFGALIILAGVLGNISW